MQKDYFVRKHEYLIHHHSAMTTMEQRLLDFSIGKGIDENTAEFRPFWVSVKELREVYPLRSDRAYAEICQAADALGLQRSLAIQRLLLLLRCVQLNLQLLVDAC